MCRASLHSEWIYLNTWPEISTRFFNEILSVRSWLKGGIIDQIQNISIRYFSTNSFYKMRIYIFRILTMIHLNTFSRVCPHSRGNNATEWDSVRIWRKDLSSTGIIPVEMPDFRTRHPGQVTTVENLSREARTRGGLFISAAGELAATALSLSDVTNVAFNATSQVSYYYSPWQPSQPFHPQPRPIGTKRPFDRVHMASRPQRAFLPLSLSLSRSLFLCPVSSQICGHVGLFIQWTEERSAGFGYCFSGCREREKKKEERVPG